MAGHFNTAGGDDGAYIYIYTHLTLFFNSLFYIRRRLRHGMNGVEALCILHGCMSMSMPEFKLRCSLMGRVGYNRFVKSIKVR